MAFNSWQFVVFFAVVYGAYLLAGGVLLPPLR